MLHVHFSERKGESSFLSHHGFVFPFPQVLNFSLFRVCVSKIITILSTFASTFPLPLK